MLNTVLKNKRSSYFYKKIKKELSSLLSNKLKRIFYIDLNLIEVDFTPIISSSTMS